MVNSPTSSNRSWLGPLCLTISAIAWGFAFAFQRSAMDATGPFTFNGIRFIAAGFLVAILSKFFGEKYSPKLLKTGLILGFFLFTGASLQQVGMQYTSAGKGGFVTSLYLLFVPITLLIFWKEKISWRSWGALLIATVGLALLCLQDDFSINLGDALMLLCALLFAAHVVVVEKYGRGCPPLALSAIQLSASGVCSLIISVWLEQNRWASTINAWPALLYTIFISIGLGYTLQIIGQRTVKAHTAGLILSLESVFAALAGWLLLGEILTVPQLVGAGLILLALGLPQKKA